MNLKAAISIPMRNGKDCFAKLYCSGGCAANAYHTTGAITGVYDFGCQLHKKRIECAIMLKVAEMCEEW